jgi:hypothetical protein
MFGVFWATIACGPDQQATGGGGAREGSGDSRTYLELDSYPTVSIGGEEVPLYRVTDALLSASGEIVVVDGAPRILFFDSDGRERKSLGRGGDGPGEFRQIDWIHELADDSLVAYDSRLRRATYFSSDGEMARVLRPGVSPEPRGAPQLVGMFADGSLLATQIIPPADPPQGSSFTLRPDLRLMRYDRDGSFQADLGQFPGSELAYIQGVRILTAEFLRNTFVVVGNSQFYVAPGDGFGASVLDQDGIELGRVSRPHTPIPIQESDLAQSHTPDGTPFPFPSEFPAISSILVDAVGNLWVKPFTRQDPAEIDWSVFDVGGQFRGLVTLPGRFQPMEVGEDYVLGVARDTLDVETVHLFGLSRREGSTP